MFFYVIGFGLLVNLACFPANYFILERFVKNTFMNMSYNMLYWFSVAQIQFTKLSLLIPKNKTLKNVSLCNVNVIKNGEVIRVEDGMTEEKTIKYIDESWLCNPTPDIIRITHEDHKNINNIILLTTPSQNIKYPYEVSTIHFMSIEITHNNCTYPMFLNKTQNYYVVGNKFDKQFFHYYLKNNIIRIELSGEVKNELDYETFDYVVTIIDHNVNIIKLDSNDTLIIEKDTYILQKEDVKEEYVKEEDVKEEDAKEEDETKTEKNFGLSIILPDNLVSNITAVNSTDTNISSVAPDITISTPNNTFSTISE